jgi:hypothetical protein
MFQIASSFLLKITYHGIDDSYLTEGAQHSTAQHPALTQQSPSKHSPSQQNPTLVHEGTQLPESLDGWFPFLNWQIIPPRAPDYFEAIR